MFLEDLGLSESGLEKLIRASYKLLGLISYLTAGPTETRAWTIKKGTKAPQAAGKIHSDFERGFIKAEIVSYDDLMACGNYTAAKEKGLVRMEGKEYVVKDGDVVLSASMCNQNTSATELCERFLRGGIFSLYLKLVSIW